MYGFVKRTFYQKLLKKYKVAASLDPTQGRSIAPASTAELSG